MAGLWLVMRFLGYENEILRILDALYTTVP